MGAELRKGAVSGCRTTKIYCRPDCPAGRRVKPENRVFFASHKAAQKQGYRACKVCRPDGPETEQKTFYATRYKSPLGTYVIFSSDYGVACITPESDVSPWLAQWKKDNIRIRESTVRTKAVVEQLEAYFSGRLQQFNLPLDLQGTLFQRWVWRMLQAIPYGETRSYRDIARALGRPQAARAVGGAVGSNPVSIVIPCHRVIGSSGGLVGYGGGLPIKQALLNLEAKTLRNSSQHPSS